MAKREIGTSLKLDGEAQFKAAITNINQELRVLSSEMGAAVSSFDRSGASISDLKAKGDIYGKQLDSQREKLSVLQNAVDVAREAQAKAAQTAAEMAEKYGANSDEAKKASEAVAGITKKLNDYQIQANNTARNINQLEAAQRANNEQIEKLQNARLERLTEEFKKLASEAGKAASETAKIAAKTLTAGIDAGVKALTAYTGAVTGAATAVAGLCKEAIETGKTFDSSMSQVAATMGTTVDQIDYLAGAAKEMGATTSFTASQAADGLNILAMAGMDMKEAVTASANSSSLLETTLNMASAGALSLEASAGYLTGTIKGFGDEAANAQYYADLMAKGATLANTNVGELGASLSDVSATARSYGQEAETMTFSLLKLADANVVGEKASTSLKAAMSNLYTPTDTAKKALDALGVSAYEDGKALDFNDVVDQLSGALSGLSDEEANAYKNAIFGIQGLDAFNKMANTSADSIEKFKNGLAEAGGSTAEQAATQINNLEGDITLLGSAADGAKMAIYEALNGTDSRLRQFVQQGTEEISNLTAAFESNGIGGVIERVQEIIPAIGENLVNGISELLPTFLESFNGVVLSIVQSVSETLPTAVDSILPAMINGCTSLVSGLVQKIPSFVPTVLKGAVTLFRGILDGLNQVIAQITPMLPQIVSDISGTLTENIPTLISGAAQFFAGIVTAIAEVIPSIIAAVAELVPLICNSIIENIPLIIEAGLQLFVSLTEALPDAIVQIVAALPEIIDGIVTAVIGAVPQIIQAGIELFVALIGALPEIITTIVAALPQIIDSIVTALLNAMPLLVQAGYDLLLGIIGALPDIITALIAAIPQITDGLVNALIGSAPELTAAGVELFTAVITNLPQIIAEIVRAIPKIVSGIVNGFKENMGKMSEIGSNLIAGIGDGLIDGVTAVKNKINAAGEKIMNSFKEFFGIHSPSTRMKKEVGGNLADGVGLGFTEKMSRISADMKKAVPTSFDLDVEVDTAATARRRYGAAGGNNSGGFNFTQINNSPKALDTATINRQTRQGLQLAAVMK